MSEWQPIDEADKSKGIMAYCGNRFCGNLYWKSEKYARNPKPHWSDYGQMRMWGVKWMRRNQPKLFKYQPEPPK